MVALLWLLALQPAWGGEPPEQGAASVRWHTLHTRHFSIHWPSSTLPQEDPRWFTTERTAGQVSHIAEAAWDPLCAQVGPCPTDPVHLVVRDTGQSEGELVRDLARQLALGPELAHSAPAWWADGGAWYLAHQAGYGHWSSARDALLRTATLEGSLLTLDEMSSWEPREGFEAELASTQGYAFALWLRYDQGFDVVGRLGELGRERPRWTWSDLVEEVTGEPVEQLYERWVAHLHQHHGATRDRVMARGLTQGRELELTDLETESEPIASPDCSFLAFTRNRDGTDELYTVSPEGSRLTQLTDFADGTRIEGLDWVDDHTLVLSLHRNYAQDLWLVDVSTRELTRLTDSRADERGPRVGPHGRVWFTADPDGIFNVYTLDLSSGHVCRQTDVLGMASQAQPTAEGGLRYTSTTGHGPRAFALSAEELEEEPLDYAGLCGQSTACADADQGISWRPVDLAAGARSQPYRPMKARQPSTLTPMLRASDQGVEAGAGLVLADLVGFHRLEALATLGTDSRLQAALTHQRWWPRLDLGYRRYALQRTLFLEDDGDRVDFGLERLADQGWAHASRHLGSGLRLGLGGDVSRYTFRSAGDGVTWTPWSVHGGVGAFLDWSTGHDPSAGGRQVHLDWSWRSTWTLDSELDPTHFHRVAASWTEVVPMRWFGAHQHTLQLDLDLGWVDRDVAALDELSAGGRQPAAWRHPTLGDSVPFRGYPAWSLSGETLLLAHAAYCFPLVHAPGIRLGPIHPQAITLQPFGTVGNLWSYEEEEGGTVRRELPFVDPASRLSPQGEERYLLADVGAELRVRAYLRHGWEWSSFLGLSYGLQSTLSTGGVDADLVQAAGAGELTAAVQPPSLRVYAGIGTGW